MEAAWLEDFVALAETLNFSRAAERRNVTQPAFSRRIRALEGWVGAALVDRASHRLALTPAGEAFLPAAREVLHRLERGRQEAREAAAEDEAGLRFIATHALSLTFFPAWLGRLEAHHATGPIQLLADHMVACERMMRDGLGQFLLCHHHPAAPSLGEPDFIALALDTDVLVPVSARHADGTPLFALPGTAEAPLTALTYSQQSGMGRILDAARARDGKTAVLKPVFASHLAVALKAMAVEGRGLAWCPLSLVAEELAPGGRLTRAGGPEWDVPMEVRLVRPRARLAPAAEAFWAAAREGARAG